MFEAFWICAAFLMGFLARQIGLPPLIGYLVTGFFLFSIGYSAGPIIEELSNAGVTLLLFTIGLKLRIKGLLRNHVWAPATLHMISFTMIFGLIVLCLPMGLSVFPALLIGFALSFSSTVFAVKVLEEKGEMLSVYGQTTIGILVIQDLVAVLFMALSAGKWPAFWSPLLVVGFIPARWLLARILDRVGHQELFILFGLAAALGSYELFELAGLKGDLGALSMGALLASHRESDGLTKSLLGLKDFFLVGFFISIGLNGLPTAFAVWIAAFLVVLIPLKGVLFFFLFTRLNLRSRTSFLSALALANYSEFGLIVVLLAANNGWVDGSWLLIIALALALSFLAASPLNTISHNLYERWNQFLLRFQRPDRLPEEQIVYIGDATVLLLGMGRVGSGAYDALKDHEDVLGIDMNPASVHQHKAQGRNVIKASATDSDFWNRISLSASKVHLVMLAMPQLEENLFATRQLKQLGYTGKITAIVKFPNEASQLIEAGVDHVFNFYTEAGAGFAADALGKLATPGQGTIPDGDLPRSQR